MVGRSLEYQNRVVLGSMYFGVGFDIIININFEKIIVVDLQSWELMNINILLLNRLKKYGVMYVVKDLINGFVNKFKGRYVVSKMFNIGSVQVRL